MQRNSNLYTFIFALIVCMLCSLVVSSVFEGLRAKRELNEFIDARKNILQAAGVVGPISPATNPNDLLKTYRAKIEEVVIDKNGNIQEGMTPDNIEPTDEKYPLYIYREEGRIQAYCFPIEGKGLWSTIFGFLALESDAKTIRGITFHKHGETPGLGAEIEKKWFLDNFKGKRIWDEEKNILKPIRVVKGKVVDLIPEAESKFYVDGITGATMTSDGVTRLLDHWIRIYDRYLRKVR